MDVDSIRKLVEDGLSAQKIAHDLKIDRDMVKKIIQENEFALVKENFAEDKISKICDLYQKGVSAKTLGIKFSIDKRRIQKWVNEKKLLRSRDDSHRVTHFNQDIFDSIDTPEKAYWLGFFYADCYNCDITNTVTVSLQISDFDHLAKLAHFMNLPKDKITYTKNNQGYEYYTLKMYSKHLSGQLTKLGCPRAKSFIITYPNYLLQNLHAHFIRGIFDGDGCLTFRENTKEWKWSLATTDMCCEVIQDIFLKNIGIIVNYHNISKTEHNTCELESSGNEKITKIMHWLYDVSSKEMRLDRKYNLLTSIVSKQENRRINRDNYFIKEDVKQNIFKDLIYGKKSKKEIIKENNVSIRTLNKIKNNVNNIYDQIMEIDGSSLTSSYLQFLNVNEKIKLVDSIFIKFRKQGWVYPNFSEITLKSDYKKLCDYEVNLLSYKLNNNSSLATNICKMFCNSYYLSTERNAKNMIEIWNDDKLLKELIENRLVINWISKNNESFNISHKMMVQGMRSMRLVPAITMFKPSIAKHICMKYSEPGDLVGDYSCGFGGRLLGAMSCGRRYIGTDPLTVPELQKMVDFYQFKDCILIQDGSENYRDKENSIDLYWSSPPYYDQEYYSSDCTQAYNQGEDYFYNFYWKKTLENIKYMLKPNKWFGLNVKNYPKMYDMACEIFGEVKDIVYLKTGRSHLTKMAGNSKLEGIFMFKNNK